MPLPARLRSHHRRLPSKLDRPLQAVTLAAAAYPSLLLLLLALATPELDPLIALLICLGWTTTFLRGTGNEAQLLADAIARGFVLIGCTYLAFGSPYWLASALTAAAVLNSRNHNTDSNVIAGVLLGGFASVALGANFGTVFAVLLALPAIALAMVGVLWTQARMTRRKVRRTLRAHQHEENPRGLISRCLVGCALALLLLLVLPTSVRATHSAQSMLRMMVGWASEDESSPATTPDESENGVNGSSAPAAAETESSDDEESTERAPRRRLQSFPNALGFAGQQALVRQPSSKRLELRVLKPETRQRYFSNARPAYLRITSFEGFARNGLMPAETEAAYTYDDAGDGFLDRWVYIATDPLRGIALDLELRMTPILAPGRIGQLAIPRIEPVIAIQEAEVQHSESGMLSIPDDGRALQSIRFRTRVPEVLARELVRPRFDTRDARDTELPDDPAWQPVMEELARQWDSLPRDGQTLRQVAAHFKRNYRYSLADPKPGLEGLITFLNEKRGYCTYFATSAMLMLRMQGIPARVAAGYRVTEFDEQVQAYVAGDQVAHAWVEVRTTDYGWLPLEPTPAAGLERAVREESERIARLEEEARAKRELEEAAAAARLAEEEQLATEEAVDPAEDGALDAEADSNAAEQEEQGAEPSRAFGSQLPRWLLAALVASFLAQLIQIVLGNRQADSEKGKDPLGFDDPSLLQDPRYQRVIELFLGLGFQLGGRRTPMEFAQFQVERRGTTYAPLLPITRMLYARRYGGHPMQGKTWQRFELFERRLTELEDD